MRAGGKHPPQTYTLSKSPVLIGLSSKILYYMSRALKKYIELYHQSQHGSPQNIVVIVRFIWAYTQYAYFLGGCDLLIGFM